ncbi:MAG: hypothetical protein LC781_03940 [Actinobacteria bacterium]|nr:hypothetical protein [Actinomycetota bacterium]
MATNRDREEAQQGGGELQRRDREVVPDEGYQVYPGVNLLDERDRQRRQLGGELREIEREIEASEGYRLRNRMNLLEKSYFVFDANYLNLRHVLDEFEQPMVFLKLWEEKTRDRFDLFIDDVIRLFHNYLAGATTLLDHIDTLRAGLYGDSGFSEEYQARWEEQIEAPTLPRFMEDLLVYMLHEGLPFALAELNFGRMASGVEVNSAIRLDVEKLREWGHWVRAAPIGAAPGGPPGARSAGGQGAGSPAEDSGRRRLPGERREDRDRRARGPGEALEGARRGERTPRGGERAGARTRSEPRTRAQQGIFQQDVRPSLRGSTREVMALDRPGR